MKDDFFYDLLSHYIGCLSPGQCMMAIFFGKCVASWRLNISADVNCPFCLYIALCIWVRAKAYLLSV